MGRTFAVTVTVGSVVVIVAAAVVVVLLLLVVVGCDVGCCLMLGLGLLLLTALT